MIVLIVVAGVAVFAVVLLRKGGSSAGTYKSGVSGLTFKYPASWQELSPSDVVSKAGMWSSEASDMNENAVVDSTGAACKNVIISQSMAGVEDSHWAATVRDGLVAKFRSDPALAGEQVSAVTLKIGPAVAGSGTKTIGNQTARYRYVVLNHHKTNYFVTYLTIDTGVDLDGKWQKIEDSIGFTN